MSSYVRMSFSVVTLVLISNDLPHLCMTAEEGEEVEIIEILIKKNTNTKHTV